MTDGRESVPVKNLENDLGTSRLSCRNLRETTIRKMAKHARERALACVAAGGAHFGITKQITDTKNFHGE